MNRSREGAQSFISAWRRKLPNRRNAFRHALAILAAGSCFSPMPALAEDALMPEPIGFKMVDENGVDLASGYAHFGVTDVSIGGLVHSVSSVHSSGNYVSGFPRGGIGDSFYGGLGQNRPEPGGGSWDYRWSWVVGFGGSNETFFVNPDGSLEATKGGTLVTGSANPASFTCGTNGGIWTYTAGDGTIMTIDTSMIFVGLSGGPRSSAPGTCGVVTKVTYPDGRIININVRQIYWRYARIQSVTTNDGFQLKYRYAANGTFASGMDLNQFFELQGIVGLNNAYEVCDPLADSCTPAGPWRQSNIAWSTDGSILTVTDQAGASTRFTMDRFRRVIRVKPPTSTSDKIFYEYCARPRYLDPNGGGWIDPTPEEQQQMCAVYTTTIGGSTPGTVQIKNTYDRARKVVRDGQEWIYDFPSGTYGYYYLPYRSNGPGNAGFAMSTILGTGALLTFNSGKVHAEFENSQRNRLIEGQVRGAPEETYTYDGRGNLLSDGITTAGYPTTCSNIKTCNKPAWTKDTAGNQTDYTYDPTHGAVLTITGPAVNGVRPQTRYSYVQRHAWFKNAAGTMTRSTQSIWKPATESFCRESAATGNLSSPCAGNDEVRTTYDYGPDSGPNNLLLRGTVVTADGESRRTCYSYDKFGNKISETAPKAGLAVCP